MNTLCECGCGRETTVIKGQPKRFILGHHGRKWTSGHKKESEGRIFILFPGHPRANTDGYVREHILVVEKALGKPLPPGAMPHHVNEDKTDNRPENLVVCQDHAYHMLLHQRMRSHKACGHVNWLKCPYCKEYDDPKNLHFGQKTQYHTQCRKDSAKGKRDIKMLAPTSSVSFDR